MPAVEVTTLNQHPENPRRGNVAAIRESLRRFGQVRPIVVQSETRYVIAGNHTLQAAIEEGWNEIVAVFVDLSDEEARAYLLADNRTSDLGGYDDPALALILNDLAATGKLEGTAWTIDQLDDLNALLQEMQSSPPQPPTDTPGMRQSNTFEQDAEGYSGRAQRLLILTLPPEQYAWLVNALARIAADDGDEGQSNTDTVLKLAAERLGEAPPE